MAYSMLSCHGFIHCLTSDNAGAVNLNPSNVYVNPFSKETMPHMMNDATIKLTDWCDQGVIDRLRSVFMDAVSSLWMLFQTAVSSCSTKLTFTLLSPF